MDAGRQRAGLSGRGGSDLGTPLLLRSHSGGEARGFNRAQFRSGTSFAKSSARWDFAPVERLEAVDEGPVIIAASEEASGSPHRCQRGILNHGSPSAKWNGMSSFGMSSLGQMDMDSEGVDMPKGIIHPSSKRFLVWWSITIMAALATGFFIPFDVAYTEKPGLAPYDDVGAITEYILISIFLADIVVKFNLAYYDGDTLVVDRRRISRQYLRYWFWVDLLGVFPVEVVALAIMEDSQAKSTMTYYLSLFQLLRMVRLYRVGKLFSYLEKNIDISLMVLTLVRNLIVVLLSVHVAACGFYALARQHGIENGDTWLSERTQELAVLSVKQKYIYSMYWGITTMTTVGYGDFAPVNTMEMMWAVVYMLVNIVLSAYIIGTITLLVVKMDMKNDDFRDRACALAEFHRLHNLPSKLKESMVDHLNLHLNNSEVSDEKVLSIFPTTIRRKVLRSLYLKTFQDCYLFKGCKQRFLDVLLGVGRIDLFMPNVEILAKGEVVMDLLLLISGDATAGLHDSEDAEDMEMASPYESGVWHYQRWLGPGDAIGEVAFFGESRQLEAVMTTSVCRVFTISKSAYMEKANMFPFSSRVVLQNLLQHVKDSVQEDTLPHEFDPCMQSRVDDIMAKAPEDVKKFYQYAALEQDSDSFEHSREHRPGMCTSRQEQLLSDLGRARVLVEEYTSKQDARDVMEFLTAASRGDTATILSMLQKGFVVDSTDYDERTALILAAVKGHTATVGILLGAGAQPNRMDSHGNSALLEACINRNDDIIRLMLKHGGSLETECLHAKLASMMCTAAHSGDVPLLEHLLMAKAPADASAYDGRTALHIAASEGNVAAARVLVEVGNASVDILDRWGHTPLDEARASGAQPMIEYLQEALGSEDHAPVL